MQPAMPHLMALGEEGNDAGSGGRGATGHGHDVPVQNGGAAHRQNGAGQQERRPSTVTRPFWDAGFAGYDSAWDSERDIMTDDEELVKKFHSRLRAGFSSRPTTVGSSSNPVIIISQTPGTAGSSGNEQLQKIQRKTSIRSLSAQGVEAGKDDDADDSLGNDDTGVLVPVPLQGPRRGSAGVYSAEVMAQLAAFASLPGAVTSQSEAEGEGDVVGVGDGDGSGFSGGETKRKGSSSGTRAGGEEGKQIAFADEVFGEEVAEYEIPVLSIPNTPREPPPARPPSPEKGQMPIYGIVGGDHVPAAVTAVTAVKNGKQSASAKRRQSQMEKEETEEESVIPELKDAQAKTLALWSYFSGFSKDNPFRVWCYEFVISPKIQLVLSLINLSSCLFIFLSPELQTPLPRNGATRSVLPGYDVSEWDQPRSYWLEIFDYLCLLTLLTEVAMGSIAWGFTGPGGWLNHNLWNKMDLFILVAEIVEFVSSYTSLIGITFRPARLFRHLKIVAMMPQLSHVNIILATLWSSITQLVIVLAILGLFLVTFSIFGMAMYQKSFARQCVVFNDLEPLCATGYNFSTSSCNPLLFKTEDLSVTDSISLAFQGGLESIQNEPVYHLESHRAITGGYPFNSRCKIYTMDSASTSIGFDRSNFPTDPFGRIHSCQTTEYRAGEPVTQMCQSIPQTGSSKFVHFNHVGGAIVVILQTSVPDAFYDILHTAIESEPRANILTWVLFFSVTCLCTWLMVGIFVAVVTDTYKRETLKVEHRNEEERKKNEIDDGLTPMERVYKAERERVAKLQALEDARAEAKRRKIQGRRDSLVDQLADDGSLIEIEKQTQSLRETVQLIIRSSSWDRLMTVVVSAHMVAIFYLRYDVTEYEAWASEMGRLGCAFFFTLEIIFKTIDAGSWGHALSSAEYRFGFVVILLELMGVFWSDAVFLKVVPSVRLYRLMKYFPTLHHLLMSAIESTSPLTSLIIFMIFVASVVAITGRYMIGSTLDFAESNFGSLETSILTTFQLLTGDSWTVVMYNALLAKEPEGMGRQVLGCSFIVVWFLFAQFILQNIFIAVIIQNFEVGSTIKNIAKPGRFGAIRQGIQEFWQLHLLATYALKRGDIRLDHNTGKYLFPDGSEWIPGKAKDSDDSIERRETLAEKILKDATPRKEDKEDKRKKAWDEVISMAEASQSKTITEINERSLGIFGPKNKIRLFCIFLVRKQAFQALVMGTIILTCVMMFTTPAYSDLPGTEPLFPPWMLDLLDNLSTFIFTIEWLANVISLGLINTKYAYLKSGWNILDTSVLSFSWFDLILVWSGQGNSFGIAKTFRLFRTLRPLRLMKRNEGMRIVIDALIATTAPVAYVILFACATFAVFSLIGMGLLGGKMFYCSLPGAEWPGGKLQCSGNHVDMETGIMFPRAWISPPHNFDSSAESIVTLYRMSTNKFVAILAAAQDTTELNQSPLERNSTYMSLFFVVYMIVGYLFVMNLFVGFIVDGFNLHKGSSTKDIVYNRFPRQFREHRPQIKTWAWCTPNNTMSSLLASFLTSLKFQVFSAACVFVNVGFMLSDHVDPEPWFANMIDLQNLVFFMELIVEIFLTALAYGPGVLIDDVWKVFDVFVAAGTLVGYLISSPQITQFVKAFRLLRVVRLMIIIKKIRIILETLVKCLPQLANIMILLLLVYSMFSVLGANMFSATKYGHRLGPTANFNSWTDSIITAYQIVTGDEWMMIMDDCAVVPPMCSPVFDSTVHGYNGPDMSFGDCGSEFSPVYFISFKLIGEAIMLNLFIGMIIENFAFITDDVSHAEHPDWDNGASADQIIELVEIFTAMGLGSDVVPLENVQKFINAIPRPLGMRDPYSMILTEQTEQDRVQLKFVRAELNVIVSEHRERERKMHKGSWSGWYYWFTTCGKVRKYEAAVSFEELMMTLVHWRKPKLVPEIRKLARSFVVQDVIFMCHCLVLKDSLQQYQKKVKMAEENEKAGGNRNQAALGGLFVNEMANTKVELRTNEFSKDAGAKHKTWAKDVNDSAPMSRDIENVLPELKTIRTESKRLLEGNSQGNGDAGSTPKSQGTNWASPPSGGADAEPSTAWQRAESRASRADPISPIFSANGEGGPRKMSQMNASFNGSSNSLKSSRSGQSAQTNQSVAAARRSMIRGQSSNWKSTKPK